MSKNIRDQVWFITGASTGFGHEMTEAVLQAGGRVVATARKPETLQQLEAKYTGRVLALKLDVTRDRDAADAVEQALERFGRIDVLVNNAGYGLAGAIEEATEAEFMPMFETNVFGLIRVTKAVLPHLRKQRSGAVINLSSIGGLIAMPGWGLYNATKFAVEGLSGALAGELEPLGIHVMTVEPGAFRTDFLGRSGVEARARHSDYDATAGQAREYFRSQAGKQKGDPVRGVHAILEAVNAAVPPKHLVLGQAALGRFRKHLEERTAELDQWENTTLGADFPDEPEAKRAPATDGHPSQQDAVTAGGGQRS